MTRYECYNKVLEKDDVSISETSLSAWDVFCAYREYMAPLKEAYNFPKMQAHIDKVFNQPLFFFIKPKKIERCHVEVEKDRCSLEFGNTIYRNFNSDSYYIEDDRFELKDIFDGHFDEIDANFNTLEEYSKLFQLYTKPNGHSFREKHIVFNNLIDIYISYDIYGNVGISHNIRLKEDNINEHEQFYADNIVDFYKKFEIQVSSLDEAAQKMVIPYILKNTKTRKRTPRRYIY